MKRKQAGGFTLIEVLVAVAVLIILGAALTGLLRSGLISWQLGQSRMSNDDRAQMVINMVSDDFAAIYTRDISPPSPAIVEIPTLAELERRAEQHRMTESEAVSRFYANEWCRVASSFDGASASFEFHLPFITRSARFWIDTTGLMETMVHIGGIEQKLVDFSGDLGPVIDALTNEEGTNQINISIIDQPFEQAGSIMQSSEGPVMRFTAIPTGQSVNMNRLLLHQETGQPQKAVFVRDSGSAGLREVCYIATYDEIEPGVPSPTGVLWRAEQPYRYDYTSFFQREFIDDISVLADDPGPDEPRIYHRDTIPHGFEPIADNVLYFGIQAWDEEEWVDNWDDAMGIPRKMRMVLVLLPQTGRRTIAMLADSLAAADSTDSISLNSSEGMTWFSANSSQQRFVKIVSSTNPQDQEWVYYDNVRDASLIYDAADDSPLALDFDRPYILNRGLRGTDKYYHPAGSEVYHGETYVRTFRIPAPRIIAE